MIDINATFFVQLLHFFLVWWLLERFFFRHVVAVIHAETATVIMMRADIMQAEQELSQTKQQEKDMISDYKKLFFEQSPLIKAHKIQESSNANFCPIVPILNKKEEEKIIQNGSQEIIRKVLHDA